MGPAPINGRPYDRTPASYRRVAGKLSSYITTIRLARCNPCRDTSYFGYSFNSKGIFRLREAFVEHNISFHQLAIQPRLRLSAEFLKFATSHFRQSKFQPKGSVFHIFFELASVIFPQWQARSHNSGSRKNSYSTWPGSSLLVHRKGRVEGEGGRVQAAFDSWQPQPIHTYCLAHTRTDRRASTRTRAHTRSSSQSCLPVRLIHQAACLLTRRPNEQQLPLLFLLSLSLSHWRLSVVFILSNTFEKLPMTESS